MEKKSKVNNSITGIGFTREEKSDCAEITIYLMENMPDNGYSPKEIRKMLKDFKAVPPPQR